jgi:hypothetical protein
MSETDMAIHSGRADSLRVPGAGEPDKRELEIRVDAAGRTSWFVWLLQRVFSFPAMLGSMLVGAVFYSARSFAVDPDLWWHIRVGQDIWTTHQWPTHDPFSFTVAGVPWLAFEWLGDVVVGMAAKAGGLLGLDVLLIVLGSTIMLLLYVFATLRCGNSKAGFVAAAVLFIFANPSFSLRPQMLGYVSLILTLIVLELFRQGRTGAIWFLPPIFWLWINTHGSWVIGFGVIFVTWASGLFEFHIPGVETKKWSLQERIRLEAMVAVSLLFIPLTPYGTKLATYPFLYAASGYPLNLSQVLEWQPMPLSMLGGKLFLGAVIGFLMGQILLRSSYRLHEWALYLFGTTMAFLHVRFVLLFVPFFIPLFATFLARWVPAYDRKKDQYILNAVLMSGVAVAMLHYMPTNADILKIVSRSFPVRAVEYIRNNNVPTPMYNTYGYGGYLIGALRDRKVFIDGRGDLYEEGGAFADYLEIASLKPAAFSVLRSYGIKSCLLDRKEALATVMDVLPDWKRVYSDDVSVLFVRRDAVSELPPQKTVAAAKE